MPFVQAKCPECGGMLAVDDSKKAVNCQFCGEAFIVQEAVNNYNTYITNDNRTTHNYGEGTVVNVFENHDFADSLLKRGFIFLEDGDFTRANEYFEKVLDIEPENSQAYLGKLMAELRVRKQKHLKNCNNPFVSNNNFQKIMRYGDEVLKTELQEYNDAIQMRNKITRIDGTYNRAVIRMKSANTSDAYKLAASEFSSISSYKDAACLAKECLEKAEATYDEEKKKNIEKINLLKQKRESLSVFSNRIFAGHDFTVGIKSDGKLVVTSDLDTAFVSKRWKNIIAICTSAPQTIGLNSDGTVLVAGKSDYGQFNVSDWKNITAISAGFWHLIGLKSDGTVVSAKPQKSLFASVLKKDDNPNINLGQGEVQQWKDIVAISAGSLHTVGLKSDGTVVAVGGRYTACDVGRWKLF